MGKIRINDLARELEVKSIAVLDYLHELGIEEKKSHSSTIDEEIAEKVRQHFATPGEEGTRPQELAGPSKTVPAAAGPAQAAPPDQVRRPAPTRPEVHSLTRSIAEIKAEVRKAVPLSPHPRPLPGGEQLEAKPLAQPSVVLPPTTAGRVSEPGQAAALREMSVATGPVHAPMMRPLPGAVGTKSGEVPSIKATAATEFVSPAKVTEPLPSAPAKPSRGSKATKSPASSQPIYPHLTSGKAAPLRPLPFRRPGEPRPMHPTATRPARLGGAVAGGRAPAEATAFAPSPRWIPPMPRIAPPRPLVPEEVPITRKITITEGISIKELSEKMEVRAKEVIKRLLDRGIFATINQTLDSQTATEIARGFGAETAVISFEDEVIQEVEQADRPEDLQPRAPVVTVMGHVDHGKTSLLDGIRQTNVTGGEAGGITQHIGAYQVEVNNRKIVFLDTPGHEAFTLMRARGAKVTDIVVLVVAADDGVMPQTVEAINHARAAKVSIIVAINKIDKANAQPERVKKQLADLNLMPEAWGGDTVTVEVSARQRTNLDLLLEMILLVADLQGLKANPKRLATGTVLESRLDRGRGPVATALVQNGTLRVGDSFIVGAIFGKVRAMLDDRGRPVTEAPPSIPVEILGLEDVPQVGDRVQVIGDTLKARQISLHRLGKLRESTLAKTARLTLEQLHEQLAAGDVKELPLIIKADVQGSAEVLSDTVNKLSTEKVKVKVIHSGVGAITETDVLLASASNAVIVGFSVRPERKAAELAQLEKVDIRLHTIIYEVIDEIKKAMSGLLAVTIKEITLGQAEVRDTFRISKVGTVAGCYVTDGKVTREARLRLLRDSVVVYEGRMRSLRHFKEDVAEVRSGMECGMALENFNDIKVGDVVESFVTEKVTEPATA